VDETTYRRDFEDRDAQVLGISTDTHFVHLAWRNSHEDLRELPAEARREVDKAVIEDARAAAAIMAMNNVYYRFRHIVGKPSYAEKPARLRMNRLVQPAGSKVDFELYALAINGCEACVQAHERTVLEGGLTEDHVHDAVRIAATVNAAAVALEMAEQPTEVTV